jgi:hypothetical protein
MASSLINSQKLLIVCGNRINNADYLALYALTSVFTTTGKQVTIAKTKPLPEKFVLPTTIAQIAKVEPRKYTLSFPKGNTAVKDVQWQQDESAINLEISLQSGSINDLPQISTSGSDYDTVLYYGVTAYDEVVEVFSDFPAFVSEARQVSFNQIMSVPQAETEIIGAQAPMSNGELVYTMFGEQIQTPDLTTKLLASIIAGTGRFKHDSVTPQTFHICAELVAKGGDTKQANALLDQLFGNEVKGDAKGGSESKPGAKPETKPETKAETPAFQPQTPTSQPAPKAAEPASPELISTNTEPAIEVPELTSAKPVTRQDPEAANSETLSA